MFAQQHYGVEADIMTFGKGVAAGFPLSGLVTSEAVLADAEPWTRPSFSSSSYGGSPLACAAADAVTRVIVDERLDVHAAQVGETLLSELGRLRRFPCVNDVRGKGLLLAIDLTLPKEACVRLFHACLERGLLAMCYGPRVRINPPLVISEAQAREGVAILEDALASVEARR
jgi:4-aminobutyrate aminotransferase-like enzyme